MIVFVRSSFCRARLINADRFVFPALFVALVSQRLILILNAFYYQISFIIKYFKLQRYFSNMI